VFSSWTGSARFFIGLAVSSAPVAKKSRRHDLDWLRVGAFALLIFYHVGLAYGPYDWHLNSVHTLEWIKEGVLVTNPWRLTLLFLVSGAAIRFMTLNKTPGQVARLRIARLGPPLIFGVLVLVTIQSYIEALDKGPFNGTYLDWLAREFSWSGIANGVPLNHLWFIVYIAAYSAVVVALMCRPGLIEAVEARVGALFRGWRVLIIPGLYLILARVLLFPHFGLTNTITWDWYNHAQSLAAFLFGFFVVRQPSIWRDLERFRWVGLGVAAVALPLMMLQVAHPGGGAYGGVPRNIVVAIDQWAVITALLGFASLHLRARSGPVLAYLNDAVFTLYLAHQTVLVCAIWFLRPANLPVWAEAPLLAAITWGGSLLVYEIVRRTPLLRPIWGLRPLPGQPTLAWLTADHWAHVKFRRRRILLATGVFAPVLALAAVGVAILAYPGFDNARQYLSELGNHSAQSPMIFNAGVFVAGLMAGFAGLGFGLAISAMTGRRIVGGLIAAVFVLAGTGLAASMLFPYPDPRHQVINLALGIQIAPLLLLWGLAGTRDMPRLKVFLILTFVAMTALTVITHHLVMPGLVNPSNVGWWERAFALVLVLWVGVAALVLGRRLHQDAAANPDPDS
jgi:glucan biosynthesis protein C